MHSYNIVHNLDTLFKHGADIDVNELVSNLKSYSIVRNLDTLLKHGADINVNELVSSLDSDDVLENLDALLRNGADINLITKKMKESDIKDNIKLLRKYGAKLDTYQENN